MRLDSEAKQRLVPNFLQLQRCWPLRTQGTHPTLLDGESRRWCCGISLRYAWRRHLERRRYRERWRLVAESASAIAGHLRDAVDRCDKQLVWRLPCLSLEYGFLDPAVSSQVGSSQLIVVP